jgi:hypothetical protein
MIINYKERAVSGVGLTYGTILEFARETKENYKNL